MNPYASLYLKVADQYRRDLAHEYRHAQRGWAAPKHSEVDHLPVRRHRVRAAVGRLRAHVA
jgi:hypothetical protein